MDSEVKSSRRTKAASRLIQLSKPKSLTNSRNTNATENLLAAAHGPKTSISQNGKLRGLYREIIYVVVGKKGVKFGMHKGLLTECSAYFRSALNWPFQEAEEGIIKLDDVDPNIFDIFNTWLYTQTIPDGFSDSTTFKSSKILTELYIFGDKYSISKLKNTLIDQIISWEREISRLPSVSTIGYIYESIPQRDPIRQLFVDLYSWNWDCLEKHHLLQANSQFLIDLVCAMKYVPVDLDRSQAPYRISKCGYHTHPNSTKCTA